ncbi:MAG TPA: class I SAM-dependent methyltransferase [Pirellulales bacterium]|jgi:ubiquinone/menaquinone biosynthesis C-methylase UbiE
MIKDTEDVYRELEFGQWSQRQGLEKGERFMIAKFLDPAKRTLEAGAGGGRILLAMQAAGFTELSGFDILPEFVEAARKRDTTGSIDFTVQDGRKLTYADESFDQLVYLQQFISLVGPEADGLQAVGEAFRVLRPGGSVIISLLSMRARKRRYWPLLAWLKLLRVATFRRLSLQYQPWLRLNNAPNYPALLDRGPYVYWFLEKEAVELFASAGFLVEAIGSDAQIDAGQLLPPPCVPADAPFRGRIYMVCKKPQ